ncbi:nucleoside triphosphate pyrophosphohydrolase family protein [bacterium]|nr:nucleoside triphosphate pyrophosphohydrolase family protein [bacterium]MCP5461739.1 nucleoside triphosphate pyrophosphohydrolase family protein [bacterium]
MTLNEFQKVAREHLIYPEMGKNVVIPSLGIAGESGEVVERIKKVLRDKDGVFSEDDKNYVARQLGDLLGYIAALASEIGAGLDDVAEGQLELLKKRATLRK